MKGYSDGENLHVTFEREETVQLVFLLCFGKQKLIEMLKEKNNETIKKAIHEAEEFINKLEVISHNWRFDKHG